jgi:hypothetical protein
MNIPIFLLGSTVALYRVMSHRLEVADATLVLPGSEIPVVAERNVVGSEQKVLSVESMLNDRRDLTRRSRERAGSLPDKEGSLGAVSRIESVFRRGSHAKIRHLVGRVVDDDGRTPSLKFPARPLELVVEVPAGRDATAGGHEDVRYREGPRYTHLNVVFRVGSRTLNSLFGVVRITTFGTM